MKREIRVSRILTQWQQCYIEIEVDERGEPLDSFKVNLAKAEELDEWESYTESSENEDWDFIRPWEEEKNEQL